MLTSGTLGLPKIVGHTLEGLTGAIAADGPARGARPIWATFYDIRRYGGLQIFLRAVIGGGSLVLSESGEVLADHVARLNEKAVTHISGTPSHWRKLLMSGAASAFSPRYVRLSGEIADQAVLDGLHQAFPEASIGHAYASTEAGVGFAVNDGLEGFPADMVGTNQRRRRDEGRGRLPCIFVRGVRRMPMSAVARAALTDEEGFVDTGDMVELRGDRYHFVGRRGGIINIGGLKVHPEEIEAVINRHDEVRMSRVKSRKQPDHRRDRGRRCRSRRRLRRKPQRRNQGADYRRLPGEACAPQGARHDQVRREARHHGGRKARAIRCIMFW